MIPICEKFIEIGLVFLVLFTPLAFGSVYVWAYSIMEITVFSILIALLVKNSLIQGKQFSFPLFIPVMAFLILIFFQMMPLPPSAMKLLSPKTHELYSQTLDGYPGEMREDRGERQIIEATQSIGQRLDVRGLILKSRNTQGYFENWRTISIDPYATRTELFKIISYLGVFLLIINYVDSKRKLMRLSAIIVFSGIVVAMLGIAQKIAEAPKIYWFWTPLFKKDVSFCGPFVNPNHFAGYIEMVIPLAIGFFAAKWSHWGEGEKGIRAYLIRIGNEEGCKLILGSFFVVLMVGALFLSSSRGGVISFLGSMLFLLIVLTKREKGSRNIIIFVGFLVSIVSFLIWMGIRPLIEEFSTIHDLSRDYDMQYRFQNWKDTGGLVRDFPLFGVGLEAFSTIFPKYKTSSLEHYYLYLENDYLQLLCETGIFGFGILLWFMLGLLRQLGSGYSKYGTVTLSSVRFISLYGSLTGVIAIMIHSFWDFNWHIPSNAQLISMLTGLAIAGSRLGSNQHSANTHGKFRKS